MVAEASFRERTSHLYVSSRLPGQVIDLIRQQVLGTMQSQATPTDSISVTTDAAGSHEPPRFEAVLSAVEEILRHARTENTATESLLYRMSDFPAADDDIEDDSWAPIPPKLFHMRVRRVFEQPRAFEDSDGQDDPALG